MLIAVIVSVVGALGFFVWARPDVERSANEIAPVVQCNLILENIRDAMLYYIERNGGRFPEADTWQDEIAEAFRRVNEISNTREFSRLDPQGVWGCRYGPNVMTGIAFNRALSGKRLEEVEHPEKTVVLYEIETPRRNAASEYPPPDRPETPPSPGRPRQWLSIAVVGKVSAGGAVESAPPSSAGR